MDSVSLLYPNPFPLLTRRCKYFHGCHLHKNAATRNPFAKKSWNGISFSSGFFCHYDESNVSYFHDGVHKGRDIIERGTIVEILLRI